MGRATEYELPPADARARRFNRWCQALALLWLAVTIPLGLIRRPTDSDFQQFYVAGVMVVDGTTQDLYPVPFPDNQDNPGMKAASYLRPKAAEVHRLRKVPDITHFMSPPPSALLYAWFHPLTYMQAEWAWVGVLVVCVWVVGLQAGRFHRTCSGTVSRWEGALALLVALSPMACRSIRIRNDTPPIAVCFGVAALALLRDAPLRGAAAILLGGLLKYATFFLLPLVVVMRRWRTLAWFVVLTAGVTALAWALMGPGPFRTFATEIAPRLDRPSVFPGNQTFPGLALRLTKVQPQPPHIVWGIRGAAALVFLLLVWLMARVPRDGWKRPANVFAGSAALTAWIMAFGPVAWEHWPIFLCPWWGWFVWEGRRSAARAVVAVVAVLLMYVPLSILTNPGFLQMKHALPEPWNSSQLAGVLLTLALAAWRLARPDGGRADAM